MSLSAHGKHVGVVAASPSMSVVATPPSGPVFTGRREPVASPHADTFVPILDGRGRLVVAALTVLWVAMSVLFWVWWLQPQHRVTWFGLIANSVLIAYLACMPGYYLITVNRLRGVNQELAVPPLRVAFVVTKAPSEPWAVAHRTLEAMLVQDIAVPYDVWLCDEDPSSDTVDWCRKHGVRLSTRRGVTEYHRPEWPRRTRCKEGNLAFFYDHWGYRDYDAVAQLDCDHVPEPSYLAEMIRPFADDTVGYVAAPSMNDLNIDASWANRGRIHREGSFHGPVQLGHQVGLAPVCIGSHYAVRTRALSDIGGVGPELAEDFSTSFLLTSAGWQGAFAHRAEAHGEGPPTFAAMLTQEFQWARSLVTVLLTMVPRHLTRLTWPLRLRFLFALSFYPLLTLTTAAGLLLAPLAAVTGVSWVRIDYVEFLLRWCAMAGCLLLITVFLRRRGLLRPSGVPVISWETWLYALTRWPYIAWGVLAATLQRIRPQTVDFKVTPKGAGDLEQLPGRLVAPFVVISVALSCAALVGELTTNSAGYVFLCLLGSVTYSTVSIAVTVLHAHETAAAAGVPVLRTAGNTVAAPLTLALSTVVPLVPALLIYPAYAVTVFGW